MKEIEISRVKHSFMVGKLMEEIAQELNWPNPRQMFILGYLHDVGRKWQTEKDEHEKIGGNELKLCNYKYWQEVKYHSSFKDYNSEELDLLNYADLHVDKDGKIVSIAERLADWKTRYDEEYIENWYNKDKESIERLENKFGNILDKIRIKELNE